MLVKVANAHEIMNAACNRERGQLSRMLCGVLTWQGVSGRYVRAEDVSIAEPFAQRTFTLDAAIEPPLAAIVDRCLPVAAHFSAVTRFVHGTRTTTALRNSNFRPGLPLRINFPNVLVPTSTD